MKKTCAICGKPSGMYPLCSYHFKLKDNGKVVKCESCGKWHMTDEPCDCKKITELPKEGYDKCQICGKPTTGYAFCRDCWNTHSEDELLDILNEKKEKFTKIEDETSTDLRCLICGNSSNGKHFCIDCYKKYKDKSIDIRITNCSTTTVLDQYGNLHIMCDDGRKVRSRAEALISNWLFKEKIRSVYEQTIYYKDDEGTSKTLHPDFYLPDFELYIEYNELTNKPYLNKKEYAQKIYDKLGKKVIIMTDKDIDDISACLKPILNLN